ncbi:MAG TPA: ABC transporter permease [Actinomycetales bacterium]|jgi:ABC-type multidrug transport system permease subunit|nr:ABC transporter permease [Actinomycetales bacterium]
MTATPVLLHPPSTAGHLTHGHPATAGLLGAQVRYGVQELWRSRITFIFTFLFPLTWLVVFGLLGGNAEVDPATGVRLVQFVTPSAAAMGVLYATLPTIATTVAIARQRGLMRRLRGTPLPIWTYLAGRIGASVVFALGAVITMVAFGVVAYDVQIQWRAMPAFLVTVVFAIACFAALGLAVAGVARSSAVAEGASIAGAVALAFVSGLFSVGGNAAWADRIAAVLPLQPFNDALAEQFDPFSSGAGWDLEALAILLAWGLAGAAIAARTLRSDPVRARSGSPRSRTTARTSPGTHQQVPLGAGAPVVVHGSASVSAAVTVQAPGRPSVWSLLAAQAAWGLRAALRDIGWVFFAVAMPVGIFAFTMTSAPDDARTGGWRPVVLATAAGMTAFGVAVTSFINLPEAVARDRDAGVLKRLRGTPLTTPVYLAGRTVASVLIALITGGLIVVAGGMFWDLRVTAAGLAVAAGVVVVGVVTLAGCGFVLASLLPSAKAMTAVGLGILLPLSFFSGIFAAGMIPQWMSTVGSFFPLKHVTELVTGALAPAGPSISGLSVAVLLAWLVAASAVAIRVFRWEPPDGR